MAAGFPRVPGPRLEFSQADATVVIGVGYGDLLPQARMRSCHLLHSRRAGLLAEHVTQPGSDQLKVTFFDKAVTVGVKGMESADRFLVVECRDSHEPTCH